MENIKEKIEELVEKIQGSDDLMDQFKKDPVKAVEKLLKVDLPDEVMEKIVDGVKAKISLDKLGEAAGFLKKLF